MEPVYVAWCERLWSVLSETEDPLKLRRIALVKSAFENVFSFIFEVQFALMK